jgi:hypothetical protein
MKRTIVVLSTLLVLLVVVVILLVMRSGDASEPSTGEVDSAAPPSDAAPAPTARPAPPPAYDPRPPYRKGEYRDFIDTGDLILATADGGTKRFRHGRDSVCMVGCVWKLENAFALVQQNRSGIFDDVHAFQADKLACVQACLDTGSAKLSWPESP